MTLPRSRLALILDIALLAMVLLLFAPRLTGLPIHEWLGLVLIPPVVLHLLLSWGWIARATRSHGPLQLAGEALLTVVIVYVARRWLRVRL